MTSPEWPSTASAARRHQAVEADVDNQVAVVVHVVLDRAEDGRPALDLLVPHLDHLQSLFLGEPGPDLGAVVVALPERLDQLVAALEVLGGVAEILAGHAAEEQVVLGNQMDDVVAEGPDGWVRLEVVLLLDH